MLKVCLMELGVWRALGQSLGRQPGGEASKKIYVFGLDRTLFTLLLSYFSNYILTNRIILGITRFCFEYIAKKKENFVNTNYNAYIMNK